MMSTLAQPLSRFVVWSNVFYLLPLAAALFVGFWTDAAVLAALIVTSTAFHLSRERQFSRADIAASIVVIGVNAVACYLGNFKMPYFGIVCALMLAALYIRYRVERGGRGSIAHGWWHIIAASTLTACVFTYAG